MKSVAPFFAILMLSACATQPVAQSPASLNQSHGYVAVAIPLVIGADPVYVTLRSLSSGDDYKLMPTQAGSVVRGMWIPAGAYEIAEMVGSKRGSYTSINVAAGKITDLGGLTWAGVGAGIAYSYRFAIPSWPWN